MHCSKCGHEVSDGVNICPNCNNSIESVEKEELKILPKEGNTSKAKNNQQAFWLSALASFILIIATLVPYVSLTIFGTKIEVSLIKGDGLFFIVIAVIALICAIAKMHIGVITTGIAALALSFYKAKNISHIKINPKYSQYDYSSLIHKEIGFYLMFLGAILILVAGIYGLILKNKKHI